MTDTERILTIELYRDGVLLGEVSHVLFHDSLSCLVPLIHQDPAEGTVWTAVAKYDMKPDMKPAPVPMVFAALAEPDLVDVIDVESYTAEFDGEGLLVTVPPEDAPTDTELAELDSGLTADDIRDDDERHEASELNEMRRDYNQSVKGY